MEVADEAVGEPKLSHLVIHRCAIWDRVIGLMKSVRVVGDREAKCVCAVSVARGGVEERVCARAGAHDRATEEEEKEEEEEEEEEEGRMHIFDSTVERDTAVAQLGQPQEVSERSHQRVYVERLV